MDFTGWRLDAIRANGFSSGVGPTAAPNRPYHRVHHTAYCLRNPQHRPPVRGCTCGYHAAPRREPFDAAYAEVRSALGCDLALIRVTLHDAIPGPRFVGDPLGTYRGASMTITGPIIVNRHNYEHVRSVTPGEIPVRVENLGHPSRPIALCAGLTATVRILNR